MVRQLSFPISYHFKMTETGIEIPFALIRNAKRTGAHAKVDPGSKYCLFQRERAEELDIDVLSGVETTLSTLTGDFTAYGHTVTLHTLDLEFEAFVLFHMGYGISRNILGRIGWLNNMHFALTMDDEMIHLNSFL